MALLNVLRLRACPADGHGVVAPAGDLPALSASAQVACQVPHGAPKESERGPADGHGVVARAGHLPALSASAPMSFWVPLGRQASAAGPFRSRRGPYSWVSTSWLGKLAGTKACHQPDTPWGRGITGLYLRGRVRSLPVAPGAPAAQPQTLAWRCPSAARSPAAPPCRGPTQR